MLTIHKTNKARIPKKRRFVEVVFLGAHFLVFLTWPTTQWELIALAAMRFDYGELPSEDFLRRQGMLLSHVINPETTKTPQQVNTFGYDEMKASCGRGMGFYNFWCGWKLQSLSYEKPTLLNTRKDPLTYSLLTSRNAVAWQVQGANFNRTKCIWMNMR